MKPRISKILFAMVAATALAGCAGGPQTTRSNLSLQAPQIGAISALQREFQSRTKTVVYFAFDKDLLDAEARQRLNEQAKWILDHENIRFRVYGHTDKVGNVRYNYELGMRRANRVVDYFVSKGIARGRLEAMVSFGEDSPAVDTNDRERLNRRVVTEVHGYIVSPVNSAGAGGANDPSSFETADSSPTSGGGSTGSTTGTSGSDGDSGTSGSDGSSNTDTGSGKNPNSGRGNGDEAGDPGKSGGKNNGGDEM